MKTKFFLALSAIALVTSCSNDEVIEMSDSNAIKFSVSSGKMSRVGASSSEENGDIYSASTLPDYFNVWACLNTTKDGTTTSADYIVGDKITKPSTGTSWTNASGIRYWPSASQGKLSFYAHVNAQNFSWTAGSTPVVNDFIVDTDVSKQTDFMYAVQVEKEKPVTGGQVTMNFRHALSQIVFQAKNTNKNLHVVIDKVTICNVAEKGSFTYPTNDTDNQITTANSTINYSDGTWGTWNLGTNPSLKDYSVSFNLVEVKGGEQEGSPATDKIYSLTSANNTSKDFSANAMLLLPQNTTKWTPATSTDITTTKPTGTYFLIDCAIYNVAATSGNVNKSTDVLLWGDATATNKTKPIAIPVEIVWNQGKKYIYTFTFGTGNGGYNPGDSKPVLVPIDFAVTVDDFIPQTEESVNMKTN